MTITPIEVLLLSQHDLMGLAFSYEDVLGAIELALVEHSNATYEMHPKIGVHPTGTDPGNFIHAMPACLRQLGACGLKWVARFARNGERGFPNVTGIQICNDIETGVPLAIMNRAASRKQIPISSIADRTRRQSEISPRDFRPPEISGLPFRRIRDFISQT